MLKISEILALLNKEKKDIKVVKKNEYTTHIDSSGYVVYNNFESGFLDIPFTIPISQ